MIISPTLKSDETLTPFDIQGVQRSFQNFFVSLALEALGKPCLDLIKADFSRHKYRYLSPQSCSSFKNLLHSIYLTLSEKDKTELENILEEFILKKESYSKSSEKMIEFLSRNQIDFDAISSQFLEQAQEELVKGILAKITVAAFATHEFALQQLEFTQNQFKQRVNFIYCQRIRKHLIKSPRNVPRQLDATEYRLRMEYKINKQPLDFEIFTHALLINYIKKNFDLDELTTQIIFSLEKDIEALKNRISRSKSEYKLLVDQYRARIRMLNADPNRVNNLNFQQPSPENVVSHPYNNQTLEQELQQSDDEIKNIIASARKPKSQTCCETM